MSTVKTTNLQHPSASDVGITLGADGSVVLPQGFTGGIGTNVVQATDTTTSTTTSTSYVDTGSLSVTITPTSASSKILLLAEVGITNDWSGSGQQATYVRFDGGNTSSYTATIGATLTAASAGAGNYQVQRDVPKRPMMYLDSPATTSPVTYKVQWRVDGGTGYYNRNAGADKVTISSIIAIEVAA